MTKRVVVKLGSGVLSAGGGGLDASTLRRLAADVAAVRSGGWEVVVVSSGAILAGRERLKLAARPSTQLKQAAAAVGQSRLMRAWEAAFARPKLTVAQILLTADDLRHRERYLNARSTLLTLLRLGVVPVVNENDTVAVEEIKFGERGPRSLPSEQNKRKTCLPRMERRGVRGPDGGLGAAAEEACGEVLWRVGTEVAAEGGIDGGDAGEGDALGA